MKILPHVESRSSLIEKIGMVFRQSVYESLVGYDLAVEVYRAIRGANLSENIEQISSSNLFRSVLPESQPLVISHLRDELPELYTHVSAMLREDESKKVDVNDQLPTVFHLVDHSQESREELLRSIPMLLDEMNVEESEKAAFAIGFAVRENTEWWP